MKEEDSDMTSEQIKRITEMRRSKVSIAEIASKTGVPLNTVKSWCRRHPLETTALCLNCGALVVQPIGTREKKFCSDKCRNRWWTNHRSERSEDRMYKKTCAHCGKVFSADRDSRKYCSYKCFADAEREAACHE